MRPKTNFNSIKVEIFEIFEYVFTLMAVCSTPSLSVPTGLLEETAELTAAAAATLLKFRLILLMQRSAGRSRFL